LRDNANINFYIGHKGINCALYIKINSGLKCFIIFFSFPPFKKVAKGNEAKPATPEKCAVRHLVRHECVSILHGQVKDKAADYRGWRTQFNRMSQ
jgi:hypothetical protein